MTVTDRTLMAHERLTAHCLYIACLPTPMAKEQWEAADLADPSNLHRPYGWVPPAILPELSHPEFCPCAACQMGVEVTTIVVRFSPETIAEQSVAVELDDEDYVLYLDVIEFSISLYVMHRDKPWAEREALLDKALWDEGEDSMRLLNRVQMAVLDRASG